MSALATQIDQAASKIARTGKQLRELKAANINMRTVGDAMIAIACQLSTRPLRAEYEGQMMAEFDNKAIGLIADPQLCLALTDIGPHGANAAYLYLKGFQHWTAAVRSDEERSLTMSFGIALILLGKDLAMGYQAREPLEKIAYSTLSSDMHLREVLTPALDALIAARSAR